MIRTFRYSYYDFPNKIVLSLRHYFMTHDVIDNVARLVFLLYASLRFYFLYQYEVQTKWSKGSYTGQITTFQLTAATSSRIVHIFFKDFIFRYFDMESTYRHFDVGKMLSTQ